MRLRIITVLCFTLFAAPAASEEDVTLKDKKDKVSYGIGLSVGSNLKSQAIDITTDAFIKGFKDGLAGNKPMMTEQEMREVMTEFQKEMVAKQLERSKTIGDKNRKEGEAFLAENKKKDGVVTLPSGLQYKVIKKGTGKNPKKTDAVTVNYRGTLIDGTEFDSSYKRGEPSTFPLNAVIAGWTEALQLMKEGAKWQLFIPSNLAYGEKGYGNIAPNTVLVFEVELISINK